MSEVTKAVSLEQAKSLYDNLREQLEATKENSIFIKPSEITNPTTVSSNASSVINAAITKANTNGMHFVVVPAGEYWLTETVYLKSDVILKGCGMDATTLKIADDCDIDAIRVSAPTNNSGIMDLSIDGNRIQNYSTFANGHHGNAINVWLHYGRIERVRTNWVYKHSLLLNYDTGTSDDGLGFEPEHQNDMGNLNKVLWCDFRDSLLQGVMWGWRTMDSWMCYTNIGSHAANLYLEGGTSRFIGNHFDGDGDNGAGPEYNVYCGDGCTAMLFESNIFENTQKENIFFRQPSYSNHTMTIMIVNNIIRTCSKSQNEQYANIKISGYSSSVPATEIVISGNQILNPDTNANHGYAGIHLLYCENSKIVGNAFFNVGDDEVLLDSTCENVLDDSKLSEEVSALTTGKADKVNPDFTGNGSFTGYVTVGPDSEKLGVIRDGFLFNEDRFLKPLEATETLAGTTWFFTVDGYFTATAVSCTFTSDSPYPGSLYPGDSGPFTHTLSISTNYIADTITSDGRPSQTVHMYGSQFHPGTWDDQNHRVYTIPNEPTSYSPDKETFMETFLATAIRVSEYEIIDNALYCDIASGIEYLWDGTQFVDILKNGFDLKANKNNPEFSGHASFGYNSEATGVNAFASGDSAIASGNYSNSLGRGTKAAGSSSHVVGRYNIEDVFPLWVADTHYYVDDIVKVERRMPIGGGVYYVYRICTIENQDSSFDESKWVEYPESSRYIEIVGNGENNNSRSNARTLDWNGNEELAGDLTINKGKENEVSVSALKTEITTKAPVIISSASGNVASFTDGADGMPMELEIEIAPVQDLNGYDHPWPGGAGKNLLEVMESGGINTTTGQNDTSITNAYRSKNTISVTPNEQYVLSGIASNGNIRFFTYGANGDYIGNEVFATSGLKLVYTVPNDAYFVRFQGSPDRFSNNVQFEAGSTPSDYVPYSNICPISGWTGCNVSRTGKNLYNKNATSTDNGYAYNKYLDQTGELVTPQNAWVVSEYFKINPNTIYTLSDVLNTASVHCCEYNEQKEFVASHSYGTIPLTFTTDSTTRYIRISRKPDTGGNANPYAMLEKGSVASEYESFGDVYSITFSSEAGTVYGGTLTINKDGTGRVDVNQFLEDAKNMTWELTSTADNRCVYRCRKSANTLVNGYALSNRLAYVSGVPWGIAVTTNRDIYIAVDPTINNTTLLQSYLENNLTQIVYKTITATTYELTESQVGQILSLKGINNIYADTGKINSVDYSADTKKYVDGHIPSVPVQDVQSNGVSILNAQGVANIPKAANGVLGVMSIDPTYGIGINANGRAYVQKSSSANIKAGNVDFNPIMPITQHESVFYGLAKLAGADMASSSNPVGQFTDDAKSKISDMLNAPVSVSGTTPVITGQAGLRYICGECATLSVTAPASGCIDILFESGSTPTVLTITSAKTGVTDIKWMDGFDPDDLDANTIYEINILDGEFGVVAEWM